MKATITLLIVIALGLGAWYLVSDSQEQAPANTDETTESGTDEEMSETEGTEPLEEAAMEEESASDEQADEPAAEVDQTFVVKGSNYEFDVTEIRVAEGETVRIEFESTEGFHDWVVDEFDAATEQVQAGGTTSVTFTADQAGEYEFYCSVGNHRAQGMVGTLIVE